MYSNTTRGQANRKSSPEDYFKHFRGKLYTETVIIFLILFFVYIQYLRLHIGDQTYQSGN